MRTVTIPSHIVVTLTVQRFVVPDNWKPGDQPKIVITDEQSNLHFRNVMDEYCWKNAVWGQEGHALCFERCADKLAAAAGCAVEISDPDYEMISKVLAEAKMPENYDLIRPTRRHMNALILAPRAEDAKSNGAEVPALLPAPTTEAVATS